MNLGELCRTLNRVVVDLDAADLPELIAACAACQARGLARLTTPTTTTTSQTNMTAEQVADVFGVPVSQIYEQARQHRIPSVRLGKYVRFSLDAVRAALEQPTSTETASLGTRKKRNNGAGKSAPATAPLPSGDAA